LPNDGMQNRTSRGLDEIADVVLGGLPHPSPTQQALLERLRDYASRLANEQFHLAVLGQFKRGKSTLINALIGQPLLPMGVLPLTAVPTFLSAGLSWRLKFLHSSGRVEQNESATISDLARLLAEATTEENNPENRRNLNRVEVSIPSIGLMEKVTLIDTPGIGSTHAHNTAAALQVLPECDAALFVLSVDPPITEAELNYLIVASGTTPRIIIVLNKVDLVTDLDRDRTIAFVASVLAKRGEVRADTRIFAVSARAALDARLSKDVMALYSSGLPELEQYVEQMLARKRDLLESSLATKISTLLGRLYDETAISLRALTTPLAELDEKIAVFDHASEQFIQERESLEDLLSGEWRRTIAKLDTLCNDAEARTRSSLFEQLTASLNPFALGEDDHLIVKRLMHEMCDKECEAIVETIEDHISRSVEGHRQRYAELENRVRATAASLMNTSISDAPTIDESFQRKRDPYWVSESYVESLGAVTIEGLARWLPKRFKKERQRRRLLAGVNRAVGRNFANLHWAMRQNIDDTLRNLIAKTTESVELTIADTRNLLLGARTQRQTEEGRVEETVRELAKALQILAASRQSVSGKALCLNSG
jgi:GTP-binding protein EngB required for normal cell division